MSSSYPPYSTQRHAARENRRSNSGSRNRGNRDSRIKHEPFTEYHRDEEAEKQTSWKKLQGHLVAMFSEFIGTTMFLWFAFAAVQSTAETSGDVMDTNRLMFICLSFGLSLMVTVWAHYRISGGLFNPAVTLALCITNNVPWIRAVFLMPAQIIGGIVAAALVECMIPGSISVAVTQLSPGVSIAQGVFIEAFGTTLLIIVILMLAAEKHAATPFAPLGIGMALFVTELGTVLYTGGAVNPARAFGPSVVARTFPGHHYIYWFGPVIGALMASAYYGFCKYFNYEKVNPGQDSKGGQ